MKWTDSNTIRYLALTWLAGMLLELVPMMQAHRIDWWALGTQSVMTAAAIITRMAQSDVQAPKALNVMSFGLLNRNNTLTVPASSVKNAGGTD